MNDIDIQAKETIERIESYERNWHIFKANLLLFGFVLITLIVFFTSNQIVGQEHKTRNLICSISKEAQLNNRIINENCK